MHGKSPTPSSVRGRKPFAVQTTFGIYSIIIACVLGSAVVLLLFGVPLVWIGLSLLAPAIGVGAGTILRRFRSINNTQVALAKPAQIVYQDNEPTLVAPWNPLVESKEVVPPPLPRRSTPEPTVSRTVAYRHPEPRATVADESAMLPPTTSRRLPEFGDYEVLAEIGRGGMGHVFKARHKRLGRIVALKTVLMGQKPSSAAIERFRGEARAAAQLDHSGIVPVFEFLEHEGQYFFTMAFVEGRSLSARMSDGPIEPSQAAFIVQQTAEAADVAHQNRIVHRDIKPGNIMLDRDGSVRVTDFGLARQLDAPAVDDEPAEDFPFIDTFQSIQRLTRTGVVMGTPAYMAPEQGLDSRKAGPPADIWSLGAVLYACLTGRPPFIGRTAFETIALAVETEPQGLRELNPRIDADLEAICLRCLEKAPEDRYPTAAALATDLNRWRAGQTPTAAHIGWFERVRRFDVAYPEALPLASGVAAFHFANVQEALFVVFLLVGCRWPARWPSASRLVPSALLFGLLSVCLPIVNSLADLVPIALTPSGLQVDDPPSQADLASRLAGVTASLLTGIIVGSVLAVGAHTIWLQNTRIVWPVRLYRITVYASLIGGFIAVMMLRMSRPGVADETASAGFWWTEARDVVASAIGAVSGWLIAIPIAFGVGAVFGRLLKVTIGRLRRHRRGAFLLANIVAAAGAIAFLASVPRFIQVGQTIELDQIPTLAPGPLLTVCEQNLVGRFRFPVASIWPVVIVGKLALLSAAMVVCGIACGVLSRIAIHWKRKPNDN